MNPERTIKRQPKEINYKEKYLEFLVKEKLFLMGNRPRLYRGFLLAYYNHNQTILIDSMLEIAKEGFTIDEITKAAIKVFDLKDIYKEESNE